MAEPSAGSTPSLAEQVAQVPTDPGCYLWKDASGKVVYVGKAKNLRARMRQYVTLQDDRAKIPLMMEVDPRLRLRGRGQRARGPRA